MILENSIITLYDTFKKYQLNNQIVKCPCGCINDEEEKLIYSKSLNYLEIEDLSFYISKAITTWGNENDFKHFLPRILELYSSARYNNYFDLDIIWNKLEYGRWKDWDKKEIDAIKEYIINDWFEFINFSELEISFSYLETYSKFCSADELIKNWNYLNEEIALKKIVDFIDYEGYILMTSDNPILLNNKGLTTIIRDLLFDKNLTNILENKFFEIETENPDFAQKISNVLQMIEIEIKNKNGS